MMIYRDEFFFLIYNSHVGQYLGQREKELQEDCRKMIALNTIMNISRFLEG
jgi:hypothetical protein